MIEISRFEAIATALAMLRGGRLGAAKLRAAFGQLGDSLTFEGLLDSLQISKNDIPSSYSTLYAMIESDSRLGISALTFGSSAYPKYMTLIEDAPPILFVRGSIEGCLEKPGIAIVGTRQATKHGLTIAERLGSFCADAGYCVVSGLALGVDAAAHTGALRASSGTTVAVLAHGLKSASPKANQLLAHGILEAGGAWVSEHASDVAARPEFFVQRNRIQVGLSCASVIVEGQLKSGSSTQAEYCLRNGRELFAVLPASESAVHTQHELPRMLVESRGAHAIRSKNDYHQLLNIAEKKSEQLMQLS